MPQWENHYLVIMYMTLLWSFFDTMIIGKNYWIEPCHNHNFMPMTWQTFKSTFWNACVFMYEFCVAFAILKEEEDCDITTNMVVTTRHIKNLYMTPFFVIVPKMATFESHQPKAYSPSILVKERYCIEWNMRL